jgi:TolC family type I secretion outer membrane protein
MKLYVLQILILFLGIRVIAVAQQKTAGFESLSIEDAVKLALENHPSIRAAEANARNASAGFTQAASAYYPSLSTTEQYSRTDGAFVFNPTVDVKNQTYDSYSAVFNVNQMIFDFGRTIGRVSANSSLSSAADEDYNATRQTVALNAHLAYLGLVQARQIEHVDEEAVASAEQHLRQAKAFFSVGKRAQFDVTKAEVDLANANVALITARNNVRLAKLQLENAMGIHPKNLYSLTDSFSVAPFDMAIDSVKNVTSDLRPELISARERVKANQSLVTAAKGQHLPTISAFGTWTWSNFNFPLYNRWVGGLSFTLPLFQGFGIAAQVEQAEATADASQANLDVLTDAVQTETEQYYLAMKEANERIDATTKLLGQAEENLNLAEKQYAAGVNSVIEVTDAQLSLSNARITHIQALYDYNSSLIHLKRAMGVLLK